MNDTAEETGTITQCLYSNGNRIKIAEILVSMNRMELVNTILEDLLYHVQNMVDEYCIAKE